MKKKFIKLGLIFMLLNSSSCFAITYVFVSFSLNDETLKSYYKEAESFDAVLVMRGLIDDSFMATKAKLDELKIAYNIDPDLFEKYQVKSVPTIVQDDGTTTKKMIGNIKLSEVLRVFNEEEP